MSVNIKHGILELPHELPNNLKMPTAFSPLGGLSCLHKKKKTKKSLIELKPSAQSFQQNNNFVHTSKKLLKNKE